MAPSGFFRGQPEAPSGFQASACDAFWISGVGFLGRCRLHSGYQGSATGANSAFWFQGSACGAFWVSGVGLWRFLDCKRSLGRCRFLAFQGSATGANGAFWMSGAPSGFQASACGAFWFLGVGLRRFLDFSVQLLGPIPPSGPQRSATGANGAFWISGVG